MLVLYNMLENLGYHLGVVVPADSKWYMYRGKDLANNSYCSWILVAITDALQLYYKKHHHSTIKGLEFSKQR